MDSEPILKGECIFNTWEPRTLLSGYWKWVSYPQLTIIEVFIQWGDL